MPRPVAIGAQGFADIREQGYFCVDKTAFVRDWWRSGDAVTLVCRPRRFGKTLTLSMVECFFSTRYAGRESLFSDLDVWNDQSMRGEQGTWPVVSLSFASAKGANAMVIEERICEQVALAYRNHADQVNLDVLNSGERDLFTGKTPTVPVDKAPSALNRLCELLYRSHGRKAVVLLDEYDTPLQEAWLSGCWDELLEFVRPLMNATFKANEFLQRGLITGITRVAHESIFSDLNNLKVVTVSSDEYAEDFGFTQAEVDGALEEFGLSDTRGKVRRWYDGFTFGNSSGIYNPWSITNYLDTGKTAPYWANSSSNALVSDLVSSSDSEFKTDFEKLLAGGFVNERLEDQIVFPELEYDPAAVWSLLVASGYLTVAAAGNSPEDGIWSLSIVNHESMLGFESMVRRWFAKARVPYNAFVRALLAGNLDAMNAYMNEVALDTFSTFDTGNRPSGADPERFYHGFVLGLLVELRDRYSVKSNRESGFGRYDVVLFPRDTAKDPGIVIEFKVRNPRLETTLEACVASALSQIQQQEYATELVSAGVPEDHVRAYGFAFEGKRVLVGE